MAGQPWALGKRAFGFCDLCSFRYPLKDLHELTIKLKPTNLLACPSCWTPDQPQLQVGMKKVIDPQALRRPRPDNSYRAAGRNTNGYPSEGSRVIYWGWNPVGFNTSYAPGLPNTMIAKAGLGKVEVSLAPMPVKIKVLGLVAVTHLSDVRVIIGEFDFSGTLVASGAVGNVSVLVGP